MNQGTETFTVFKFFKLEIMKLTNFSINFNTTYYV